MTMEVAKNPGQLVLLEYCCWDGSLGDDGGSPSICWLAGINYWLPVSTTGCSGCLLGFGSCEVAGGVFPMDGYGVSRKGSGGCTLQWPF